MTISKSLWFISISYKTVEILCHFRCFHLDPLIPPRQEKLAGSLSEGMFQLSVTRLDSIYTIEQIVCGI